MMRFVMGPEPKTFDDRCRQRGLRWLQRHPNYDRPHDYWSAFEPDLRRAFLGLCAYCAMRIPKGEVDHFIPVAVFKQQGRHELAYEWSNLRYADAHFNRKKQDVTLLDPFRVKDEWFAIVLPSLELVITKTLPARQRRLARSTLTRLGLDRGEIVLRYRAEWFEMYREGKLTLTGLRDVAPLIARAVERDLEDGKDWRYSPRRGSGRQKK
jgi:hypothetical protein